MSKTPKMLPSPKDAALAEARDMLAKATEAVDSMVAKNAKLQAEIAWHQDMARHQAIANREMREAVRALSQAMGHSILFHEAKACWPNPPMTAAHDRYLR